MEVIGRSLALDRWMSAFIFTFLLSLPAVSHSAPCDIASDLRQRLEAIETELPKNLQHYLTPHRVQSQSSENYVHFFTNAADPNSLTVYNIRTNDPVFAAENLAKHFQTALPAEHTEPVFRRMIQQSKEMEGALSIRHQTDPDGGHSIKLYIDTLPKAPGSPSAHDSILTLPTERTVMDGMAIPRFEVIVKKDSLTLFTAEGSGRQEGKWIVTDLSTSHGFAFKVLKLPHEAHEPLVLKGDGLSQFFFGPKSRPGLVKLLDFAETTGSGIFPGHPVILKLFDKSYRFNPSLKAWEPI